MKNYRLCFTVFVFFTATFFSCKNKPNTLFKLLSPSETRITFANTIAETDSFNILTQEYIYNGGGVGVADFNNDGNQDIFFCGNEVPNRLYLNKTNLKFEDITEKANVNVEGRWNSGVAVVDINNDGWMDIYVCATMKPDSADRKNMLFINKGSDKNGVPVFSDEAKAYGLADAGFSVTAAFLDYDHDGDLDVYILTNERLTNVPTNYRVKIEDGSSPNNDRLYRNNGNNTFTNVSREAGIRIEGFGLGLSVADFNLDGWPDIYVSNDYLSNDILYVNQKNGTFKNQIAEFIGHQSQFSMGNDAADFNNDAAPDIITLDMLPETNARKKTTISNKSYSNYINNEKFQYQYQYVRNMLHMNNGLSQEIKFSEIGQLAGVYQTEWSWSPLFADIDNDGFKDLIITNGFPKDITDKDFGNYRADVGNIASPKDLVDSIPVIKIPNYIFKNNGDLTFSDVTNEWGFSNPSFSNGASFADFDNDGDLDYVINNINDPASIYENTLYSKDKKDKANNFLRISLKGSENNLQGIGTKITLINNKTKQYYEQNVYRGFLSSVEAIAHFGLGTLTSIDSVIIDWPDGKSQLLQHVKAKQLLNVKYEPNFTHVQHVTGELYFKKLTGKNGINYKHSEEDKIDFNLQRTMPHKFSQSGPGISVGDLNNDGLEDFIIGGSANNNPSVFFQKKDGSFFLQKKNLRENKKDEDEGLLLFDADNDHDLDLYIVSGSVENTSESNYFDHFYRNDGKGNFTPDYSAIPEMNASGSCARAADYDNDGDLDLFIGGRVVPGSYPLPGPSYILQNENGKFKNVTAQVCNEISKCGMATDALWTDFDNDEKIDLVVVGEFMPITFFKNNGSTFNKLNDNGIDNNIGWWNSIASGDFDNDGDIDYVAGNLGENSCFQVSGKYTLKVFAKDFDGNGSIDPIMSCYMRESMDDYTRQLYPLHFWDELNSQSPKFRNKFSRYRQYSKATMEDLLSPEDLKDALVLEANNMATSYIENSGNGKFKIKPFPKVVQVAPVNGIITEDINSDGNADIIMVGNDYGNEVFVGRYDAFTGLVLLGDGKGNFSVAPSAISGFYVGGDAKALVRLSTNTKELYLATQNRDSLAVFTQTKDIKNFIVKPLALDTWAELEFENGKKQRLEFHYGSGYLSQSSRSICISGSVRRIIIHDSRGTSREILHQSI
jgi:hypothetical protein